MMCYKKSGVDTNVSSTWGHSGLKYWVWTTISVGMTLLSTWAWMTSANKYKCLLGYFAFSLISYFPLVHSRGSCRYSRLSVIYRKQYLVGRFFTFGVLLVYECFCPLLINSILDQKIFKSFFNVLEFVHRFRGIGIGACTLLPHFSKKLWMMA